MILSFALNYSKHYFMKQLVFIFLSFLFITQNISAQQFGIDGIIVSNHGGRQLDAGQSSIHSLTRIVKDYGDKIKIMLDSGLRSGPDIARALASGAQFTFLGRSFMYGVAALGKEGGNLR